MVNFSQPNLWEEVTQINKSKEFQVSYFLLANDVKQQKQKFNVT